MNISVEQKNPQMECLVILSKMDDIEREQRYIDCNQVLRCARCEIGLPATLKVHGDSVTLRMQKLGNVCSQ